MAGIKAQTVYKHLTEIAKSTGHTRAECKAVIDKTFDVILRELEKGERVSVTGFGTFSLRFHKGMSMKHSNGKVYQGYPHYYPKFEASIPYKMRIRELSKDKNSHIYAGDRKTA